MLLPGTLVFPSWGEPETPAAPPLLWRRREIKKGPQQGGKGVGVLLLMVFVVLVWLLLLLLLLLLLVVP